MPNKIIEFIYLQPNILGASVVIYDSTTIGRDAAMAMQGDRPRQPALMSAVDDGFAFVALRVTSYS